MSYSFVIEVSDGKAEIVLEPFYPPPDGRYQVGGHIDELGESITVTRYAPGGTIGGTMLAQATGYTRKAPAP